MNKPNATREWWQDENHFFNGDRLETAKRELEEHRATIYYRWASGHIETLFGTIMECKPDAIIFRTHDWNTGATAWREIKGTDIADWLIGAKRQ